MAVADPGPGLRPAERAGRRLAMGFAVIPTVFAIAEDAVHGVPRHLITGSLALGATRFQTLLRVVLLTASPGIFSA